MKTHLKSILVIGVTYAFFVSILFGLGIIIDTVFGLIGAFLGFLIATGCILFAIYGLRDVIAKDLEAPRVTSGLYTDVNRIVAEVTYKEGIPKPLIYGANDHAPHALSVGTDMKTAGLFVTRGLVEKLNEDELKAYVTHELAHIQRGDHLAADIGAAVAYFILLPTKLFDGIDDGENIGKLLSLMILGLPAALFIQLAAYRGLDYEADKYAAEIHGQGYSLASALNTGQKDIRRHPINVPHYCAHLFTVEPITAQTQAGVYFVSHVPTPKRITRLKRLSKNIVKRVVYKSKGIT